MKYLTDRNIRTLFLIGMGIYFLVEQATRERPLSSSELVDLTGQISNYSFEDILDGEELDISITSIFKSTPTNFRSRLITSSISTSFILRTTLNLDIESNLAFQNTKRI